MIIDDGVSGGIPLWDREGGGLLLDRIESGKYKHIIAVKLDRLFRLVSDALDTIDYLHTEDIGVHIIDLNGQALDTSSTMGRFFITMMAALAEMERVARSSQDQADSRAVVATSLAGKVDSSLTAHLTDMALEAADALAGEEGGSDLERLRVKRLMIKDGSARESEILHRMVLATTRKDISTPANSHA